METDKNSENVSKIKGLQIEEETTPKPGKLQELGDEAVETSIAESTATPDREGSLSSEYNQTKHDTVKSIDPDKNLGVNSTLAKLENDKNVKITEADVSQVSSITESEKSECPPAFTNQQTENAGMEDSRPQSILEVVEPSAPAFSDTLTPIDVIDQSSRSDVQVITLLENTESSKSTAVSYPRLDSLIEQSGRNKGFYILK